MSNSIKIQAWLTLAALAIVWGSSYLLIKKSLLAFEPTQVGMLRLAMAGLAFVPLAISRCKGLSLKVWAWMFLVGLFGTGLPSFLFPLAQEGISSSLAAAMSSMTPLNTLVVAVLFFKMPMHLRQAFGILVGLFGALWLIAARFGFADVTWPVFHITLAFLATLCYAFSSNIVKHVFADMNPLQMTAGALAPIGIAATLAIFLTGGLSVDFQADENLATAYLSVFFLGLIGTALASWLFFRLVQLTEPVFASTVSYIVPIIAFGWGLFDGEVVTIKIVLGLVFILAGVSLAKNVKPKVIAT